MAYARKGPDSDIYMICNSTGYECQPCDLMDGNFFFVQELVHMAGHILDHVERGHKVPTSCLVRILRELTTPEAEEYDELPVRCDVCDAEAEPGAILSHCVECGNCLDHCGCSMPDYDALAKDDPIDFPERYA